MISIYKKEIKIMKKSTKNINDTNALDFYDTLTDKQRANLRFLLVVELR